MFDHTGCLSISSGVTLRGLPSKSIMRQLGELGFHSSPIILGNGISFLKGKPSQTSVVLLRQHA